VPVFIIHECSNILIARYGWSKTAQKAFAYFGNLCKSYSSYNKKKIRFHIFYDTLSERKIQLLAKWKKGYKLLKKHKQFYRRKMRDENPIV